MDNPVLYNEVNYLQQKDTQDYLDEYLNLIKWNPDGDDKVLEIGCGTGNITCNILLPLLPKNINSILAVDVNENMIQFAEKKYKNTKIKFGVLDILKDPGNFKDMKIDHVFSFHCLNWIQDQKTALKNIYTLLRPGGSALLCFACTYEKICGTYVKMAADIKWQKYMYDVQTFLSPYQEEENPTAVLKHNLQSVGFQVDLCELKTKETVYPNNKALRDFMEAVNPFSKRIPESDRAEFFDYMIDEMKGQEIEGYKIDCAFTLPYTVLISYAVKPQIDLNI